MNAVVKQTTQMMKNRKGHFVPVDMVEPLDIARDEFVREFLKKADAMQQQLITLKQQLFGDFDSFVKLSAEQYGVEFGGVRGNVTLTSFDGEIKIQLSQQDRFDYDERLNVAKSLIDEFFTEAIEEIETALNDDEDAAATMNMQQIKAIIDDIFQVGKKGKINLNRILSLRHYKFDPPKWKKAMEAISDSIHSDGTTPYIRIYRKNEQGKFKQVVLDFAGL